MQREIALVEVAFRSFEAKECWSKGGNIALFMLKSDYKVLFFSNNLCKL